MKKLLLLLVLLLPLVGCTALWQPTSPLIVATNETSGHPGENGMVVTFSVSGGTGTYVLDPGDGSKAITMAGTTVQHTYTAMGQYVAVISSGTATKPVKISVLNSAPIVYSPFTVQDYDWMNKMVLDARYRVHGCDKTGNPTSVTGVRDPDGDQIVAYEWEITGPDGHGNTITYSIFDPQRNNITGQKTDNAVIVSFMGWGKIMPPYPFILPMCSSPDPNPAPPPVKTLGTVTVTLRAYDQWGAVGEKTEMHTLQSSACSH